MYITKPGVNVSLSQGLDIPDIQLVIQWRATCKLPMLWQHFDRAVRNKTLTGTALLLAEKEYFDDERAAKAVRKAQRKSSRKRKAQGTHPPNQPRPPAKCQLVCSSNRGHGDASEHGPEAGSSAVVTSRAHASGNTQAGSLQVGSSDESESDDDIEDGQGVVTCSESSSLGLEGLLRSMSDIQHTQKQSGHCNRRRKRVLDPAVDYLINAENQPGFSCRRKVFDVCFDNSTAGGNFFCLSLLVLILAQHSSLRL